MPPYTNICAAFQLIRLLCESFILIIGSSRFLIAWIYMLRIFKALYIQCCWGNVTSTVFVRFFIAAKLDYCRTLCILTSHWRTTAKNIQEVPNQHLNHQFHPEVQGSTSQSSANHGIQSKYYFTLYLWLSMWSTTFNIFI